MRDHLTEETLRRLKARELAADEVVAAFRHIAACDTCTALSRAAAAEDAERLQDLLAADAAEPPRHLTPEELSGWIRRTLDAGALAAAAVHLEDCALCREDVADLERLRAPRARWPWLAAAAAVAAAIATLLLGPDDRPTAPPRTVRTDPPRVTKPTPVAPRYANAEWVRLVDEALATGRLPRPITPTLPRPTGDTIRGSSPAAEAKVAPTGIVVEDAQPELTWSRIDGAIYVVSIFDGDEEVVHSSRLTGERWTPPHALPRGRTYTWQVEASGDGFTEILPAPPAPPATFHILGAREHDELEAARRRHPNDHLLLAVLHARNGLTGAARKQLDALRDSSDPRIRRLRANE